MAEDGYCSDDDNLSTISLTSSVCDTVEYLARVYSVNWPTRLKEYFLPVDEVEADRLDYQHQLFLKIQDGKLHQAPLVHEPQRILDLGTGTGIWSIDIGDLYPSAEVVGIDKVYIQSPWVPPNVRFEIDDLGKLHEHPRNYYDMVYARDLNGFLPNPGRLPRDVLNALVPGGYFERVELDRWAVPPDSRYPYFAAFCKVLTEKLEDRGYQLQTMESLRKSMEDAGFEGVQMKKFTIRLSRHKSSGFLRYFMETLYVYAVWIFTQDLQLTKGQLQILLALIRNEILREGINLNLYSIYGQKPGLVDSGRHSL